MRKLLFLSLIVIALLSSSCKDGKLFTFEVSDETTVTVPNSLTPFDLPFDIPTPLITTNSESEFEKNDTRVDLVKEIVIRKLNVDISSPAGQDFSFLKSIHLYISTDDSDEIELAWKDDISSNATSIQLELTDKILDKYVKSEKYKIRTKVVTKETLFRDIDLKIGFTFRITANLVK